MSEKMSLVVQFMVTEKSPLVGMCGIDIEKKFGINFVDVYNSILDFPRKEKAITDKRYVIKPFDYIRISGEYGNVSGFGVEVTSNGLT